MAWAVFFAHEAQKNLKKVPAFVIEKTKAATLEIAQAPFSAGKPLRGELKGYFSFRIGDYRLVYVLNKKKRQVYVLYVRHRREAYR
jgi:mRNA interferase RelE/StbE